jgi:hypothetical protein
VFIPQSKQLAKDLAAWYAELTRIKKATTRLKLKMPTQRLQARFEIMALDIQLVIDDIVIAQALTQSGKEGKADANIRGTD